MADDTHRKEKCPKCKKYEALELIYGASTEEDADLVKQGLAIPGVMGTTNRRRVGFY